MRTMSRDERLRIAEIHTKRLHPDAVKALGETLTPEERSVFEHWLRVRSRIRGEISSAPVPPRRKRIAALREAIREVVVPLIGEESEADPGVEYWYEVRIGRWTVHTRIDFSGRWDDFSYDQIIRFSANGRELRRVSVESWFGICGGMTSWVGLSEEEIPKAAATLALVCKRFLDAAPLLLPEGSTASRSSLVPGPRRTQ